MKSARGANRERKPGGMPPLASSGNSSGVISLPPIDTSDIDRLLERRDRDPHKLLGAHVATLGDQTGVIIRAHHPDATSAECILGADAIPMERIRGGLFGVFLPNATLPAAHRIRFHYANGGVWEIDNPYRFLPTIGALDLHLFNEGTHHNLWKVLGAHPRDMDGVAGTSFAVWAPNALSVSVAGTFCNWDGRLLPMRQMGASGVFELFVPGVGENSLYKFEIVAPDGSIRVKTDPFAAKMQQAPETAAIVIESDTYHWCDSTWTANRPGADVTREPMLIYELHMGSWACSDDGLRRLSYREIAPRLAAHVARLGFTHVEFLPIAEHPFEGSWGYQITGYYAPASRFGTPDDFRFLVDTLHQANIGVILDWVPAHFPKDDFALARFDGTALYEHEDPRRGEHPDWGTLIFNVGRPEVRNFLVANALYGLQEFHVDGLRVDAVASMLYLDYSRKAGEWLPNRDGGRENLDAIDFLRDLNSAVSAEYPGRFTVAEESTAWPGVTSSVHDGGLGFTFKWNMGWMHDTLAYFANDPLYRSHHQGQLTFAMVYEYSERFIMPLSHDEVVHLKRSLLQKMPGDEWQRFANLRLLLAYQYTRPGKKLLFMGTELAPATEWNHDLPLEWNLGQQPMRAAFATYMEQIGKLYKAEPSFWRADPDPEGFAWIDVADEANSVVSYVRRDTHGNHVVVVLNLTPVPRDNYRIGAPEATAYTALLSTDDTIFGGSGYGKVERVVPDASPYHGFAQSMVLTLPPLAALVYAPESSASTRNVRKSG